ncbi:MAG: ABC transporter substrate binding protein [Gallionellaceae bacterium]
MLSAAVLLLAVTTPVGAMTSGANGLHINSAYAHSNVVELFNTIDSIRLSPVHLNSVSEIASIEVRQAIESYPDVVVFPIHFAGPAVATSAAYSRRLANKIADASGKGSIAVLYPDIGEPYRSIFTQIIGGIEEKTRVPVSNFAVGKELDVDALRKSLRSQDAKVVIALGRRGIKAASSLNESIDIVAGGVLTASDDESRNMQVNSLSPDPALLFSRLKEMQPRVRQVFAVYNPHQNTWMINLAKAAARAQGLKLVTYKANNLRSAMHAYKDVLSRMDSRKDALWLLQDSITVDNGSVLPLVLQESWSRNLTVFSSSFGHVRRGVLFSLYPNNVELGRHLAHSALGLLSASVGETFGIFPLREVLMAVNLRTAKHLGLNVRRQQGFDKAFPER